MPRHFEDGHVILDDVSSLADEGLNAGIVKIKPPETERLDDSDDLGGFKVADFRRFWHVIFCWSIAACGAYMDAWFSGKPQRTHLTTQLIKREALISKIADVSALPCKTVARIVDRMTFGSCGARNPDIFLQPFVEAGDLIAWSPYQIQVSAPERNMLKLMARTKQWKNRADDLIGDFEKWIVRDVAQLLSARGWTSPRIVGAHLRA